MSQVEEIRITVINTDLSQEKQSVIRQDMNSHIESLNQQDSSKSIVLGFINNQENRPLSNVVVANPRYDLLLSGFDVTRKDGNSKKIESQAVVTDDTPSTLQIDPTLRFSAYQSFLKRQKSNSFRMKKVIFVGDLNLKIREFVHLGFQVHVETFTGIERKEVSAPIEIKDLTQLPKLNGVATDEQIEPADIARLAIGDIWFDGVINIQGENDQFFIQDQTLVDTLTKAINLEGEKEAEFQKVEEEEKLRFVKKKKVVVMLEPAIRRVVSSRLKFDEMEQIFDFSLKATLFNFLDEGLSKGVIEILESKGLEEVAKLLDNQDRDMLLIGMLGKDLLPKFLTAEAKTFGSMIGDLEEAKKAKLFELMHGKIVDQLIKGLQETSMESFLSRVRSDLREEIILELFEESSLATEAWKALGDPQKDAFLKDMGHEVLASLMLTNSPMFKKKFPEITFELDQTYDSSKFKKLDQDEAIMKLGLFAETLQNKRMGQAQMDRIFAETEFNPMIGTYISLQPKKFFNFFEAEVRKQLWSAAGSRRKDAITKKLTPRDKGDIIIGGKDHSLTALVNNVDYLADLVKKGEYHELAGLLLLYLKQFNKGESKTGLLTRIATKAEYKQQRLANLISFFASDSGKAILEKLSLLIEDLSNSIDSVVCLSDDVEELSKHEALVDAQFTRIDDVVDTSLMKLLGQGSVDLDKFERIQDEIEVKIKATAQKLRESGKRDPVGNYLSESMIILLEITTHAMHNKLTSSMLEQLDERNKAKEEILDQVDANIDELKKELVEATKKFPAYKKRSGEITDALRKMSAQTSGKLKELQGHLRQFDHYQAELKVAEVNKKKVAITQKKLSIQFSRLISPLLLNTVKKLPNPVSKLFGSFKSSMSGSEKPKPRVIFNFKEEELNQLMKHNIVFCTNDEFLKRFIVTCLKIDRLDDKLFSIVGSSEIPSDPELLFVGSDLEKMDFSNVVEEDRKVLFADQVFYKSLHQN